jgi:four helix bundle protein
MNEVKSFEDLEVWKKSVDIADLTYEITEGFPKQVQWSLGTQMQRSSVSMGSNIAEGCERQHTGEYIQFCHISLGSCAELYTQLAIAARRKYVSEENAGKLKAQITHARRMTKNMIKSLRLRKEAKNA